ncbi:MAG TPA: metallophosphoesterase family protein [Stellaceae bacterium]|nr:metallophosphoesterase family protein [Stellaceae bacterium]
MRNLVRMDGPVLVFGGPYGNFEATVALLAEARRRAIPTRNVVCTGDVVAYAADALATTALIRRTGLRVVMGNCEESLGGDAGDCGCGFAEGSACAALSVTWYAHAQHSLDAASRRWMRLLPRRLDLIVGRRRLAVIHGGARRINRFIFASTGLAVKRTELAFAGCDGIVAGHCGLPFSQLVDGRLRHNAGAIGMPANDGTSRVWYATLTPQRGGLLVEHHSLAYDHASAAAKMREAGLPEGYAAALECGLWPSCDVLPAAERASRGKPLRPVPLFWPAVAAAA